MDASKAWPFPDACARAIRSEHMLEHMAYEEARVYFWEAFRVLEPGGVARTGTPDLEGIARAYLDRRPRPLEVHGEHGYDAPTWSHLVSNHLRFWTMPMSTTSRRWSSSCARQVSSRSSACATVSCRHEMLVGSESHDMSELEALLV